MSIDQRIDEVLELISSCEDEEQMEELNYELSDLMMCRDFEVSEQ